MHCKQQCPTLDNSEGEEDWCFLTDEEGLHSEGAIPNGSSGSNGGSGKSNDSDSDSDNDRDSE